jgi:hypothetical protein
MNYDDDDDDVDVVVVMMMNYSILLNVINVMGMHFNVFNVDV